MEKDGEVACSPGENYRDWRGKRAMRSSGLMLPDTKLQKRLSKATKMLGWITMRARVQNWLNEAKKRRKIKIRIGQQGANIGRKGQKFGPCTPPY